MKGTKLDKINLRDFLEQGTFILYRKDASHFSAYIDFCNKFMKAHKQNIISEDLKELLIQNEDKIDKGKLIFSIYINLKNLVKYIKDSLENGMQEINDMIRSYNIKDKKIEKLTNCKGIDEFQRVLNTILSQVLSYPWITTELRRKIYEFNSSAKIKIEREKDLKKCEMLLRNQNILIEDVDAEGRYAEIEIISSKEEIDKEKSKFKDKLKILDEIDKTDKKTGKGVTGVIQLLKPEDFIHIIPDIILVNNLRDVILNNAVLKKLNISLDELDNIRIEDEEKFEEKFEELTKDDISLEMRNQIMQHVKFIDLDKLLLLSLSKFEQYIETNGLGNNNYKEFYKMCCFIYSKIEDSRTRIDTHIEIDDSLWKEVQNCFESKIIDLQYSFKDAEKFICRMTEYGYISKEEFDIARNELLSGKKKITDFTDKVLYAMDLSGEELGIITENDQENAIALIELNNMDEERILMTYREQDFIDDVVSSYIIKSGRISPKTAVRLCYEGKISTEVFKDLPDYSQFSSLISIENDINKKYLEFKYQEEKEDIKLDRMIELYKIFNIDGKEEEEQDQVYENVIDGLVDNLEDDTDVIFFWKRGLICIDSVAELCGENTINEMYNDGVIKLGDLDGLFERKKITQEIIEKAVLNGDLTFEQKLEYMKKKCISNDGIITTFRNSGMYRADLEKSAKELLDAGVISKYLFEQLIQRDLTDLENKAGHDFSESKAMKQLRDCEIPWELQTTKKEVRDHFKKEETEGPTLPSDGGKSNKIISPVARYEFLKLLKCNIPNISYEKIGEDNPFYDYNFYIIQEEILGEKPLRDAIIIIERFYKDREKAMDTSNGDMESALNNIENWSKDNATYIMNYEDYLVLQGKQKELQETKKRSVVREVDGAIYTANHRSGSWASSLLYKIAQAKAGKSFKDYKGDEKRGQVIDWLKTLYKKEELNEILDLAIKIDNEEFTYEEKNGTYKLIETGEEYPDDSDQR